MATTLHHNVTGASSAAAELTKELLAPGDKFRVSKVSLTNIHASAACSVDLYIEKNKLGKFYLLKAVTLPVGATLIYDSVEFLNRNKEFGLYIKLTKSASETPSVDVIIY